MAHAELYIVLATAFAFFMSWGIGANDVANTMGTSVGSKAITITQAIIIAAVFEGLGAFLAGAQVTNTIRSQIFNVSTLAHNPQTLIFGMLSSLLSAGSWLIIATRCGWPVSTTHTIIGALIGFALMVLGVHSIYWSQITNIVLSWIVTPIIAGVISFALFRSVQTLIFNADYPIKSAKRYVPFYVFLVSFIFSLVTLFSGLKHVGLHLTSWQNMYIAVAFSCLCVLISLLTLRKIPNENPGTDHTKDYELIEKSFGLLMVFTACALAFAHGSNDVANAIGPLSAIYAMVNNGGQVLAQSPIPLWVMGLGASGIVLGLATYGYKVIATIGTEITQLTPSRGFAAQLAAASTVVIASSAGLPISTTQTLVGAILGVGFARGMAALNLSVIRNIFLSWVITLPAGAIFAIIYFYLLKTIIPLV